MVFPPQDAFAIFDHLRRRRIIGNQDIAPPHELSKELDARATRIGSEIICWEESEYSEANEIRVNQVWEK
jgi:hypothetical protein